MLGTNKQPLPTTQWDLKSKPIGKIQGTNRTKMSSKFTSQKCGRLGRDFRAAHLGLTSKKMTMEIG